uniref:uncharacterized protein LOC109956305 n=1 Tax=Monopterus albus TaxID=43700 RepID=UPI0009B3C15F|nr:uncharacterized protein LOC109956305 [Monopterus albus]
MSNTRFQTFRNFLTERFTTVAVEIFEEVEAIVEACYEENKRLRNILHMVVNPELKLHKIDDGQYMGTNTNVRIQPLDLNTGVKWEISEPCSKKPKQEPAEFDIGCGSEQQQVPEGTVKDDPEEGTNTSCITNSFPLQVVEYDPDSSDTVQEENDEHEESSSVASDAVTESERFSSSEESTDENQEPHTHSNTSLTKLIMKHPLQRPMLQLPRMKKSFNATPPDYRSFLARLTEAFKNFPDDKKPLITKMGLTADVELVDCAFGKVPKGCPLSYQCPVPSSKDYMTSDDAPTRPLLPLSFHRLEPMPPLFTLSPKEQEHVNVMQITWEAASNLEHSTRGNKTAIEELQKLRLTNRFKEICKLKPGQSHAQQLVLKIQKGTQRNKTAQIEEEMKTEALWEYCQHLCVNWYPCGLVVHPNAPWLGALPNGLVYDPKEEPNFGLVHVKCIGFSSFKECPFLACREGVLQMKMSHSSYWHIQGEMLVTGTSWCDLVVVSREELLVQRIYRNLPLINVMKKNLHAFFHCYYLPSLLN